MTFLGEIFVPSISRTATEACYSLLESVKRCTIFIDFFFEFFSKGTDRTRETGNPRGDEKKICNQNNQQRTPLRLSIRQRFVHIRGGYMGDMGL